MRKLLQKIILKERNLRKRFCFCRKWHWLELLLNRLDEKIDKILWQ